jgi:hypothetical protein
LDGYGLNDYIIARTPVRPDKERRMAHDRLAPDQYLATFAPNVKLEGVNRIGYYSRSAAFELTEQKIETIEQYWYGRVVLHVSIPDSLAPWPIPPLSDTMQVLWR